MTIELMDDLSGYAVIVNHNAGDIDKTNLPKNIILMDDFAIKNKISDIRESSQDINNLDNTIKNK